MFFFRFGSVAKRGGIRLAIAAFRPDESEAGPGGPSRRVKRKSADSISGAAQLKSIAVRQHSSLPIHPLSVSTLAPTGGAIRSSRSQQIDFLSAEGKCFSFAAFDVESFAIPFKWQRAVRVHASARIAQLDHGLAASRGAISAPHER